MARRASWTLQVGLWPEVAAMLIEEVARPLLVLDPQGRVLMMNAAAESQTRWAQAALVERPLTAIVPTERRGSLVADLTRARAGEVQRGEISIVTPTGDRVRLRVRFAAARAGDEVALICDIEASSHEAEPLHWSEAWLDIRIDDFGRIERGPADGPPEIVGRRCFAVVVGRSEACERCPARELAVGHVVSDVAILLDERTLVRRVVRTSETTARVAHAILAPRLVRDLFVARLHAVATRALLSDREREVLAELIDGRGLEEIAAALRISERTVRFHQANVLNKLGVDSRLELVRLLIS